jgi:hypothetical protein
MHPYQQRVVTEKQELDDKRVKLSHFINSDAFTKVHPVERELLFAQAESMSQYSAILEARINQFALHDTV